jgi:hypothetical protein
MVREHWLMKLNYFHVRISYVFEYSHAILIEKNIVNIENHRHHLHYEVQHVDEYLLNSLFHMNMLNIHRDDQVELIEID